MDAIAARLEGCKGLLEIGPGPGVLTSRLSISAEKMIALEVDPRMVEALKDSAPKADVRLGDALEADLGSILRELPQPSGLVSNLPYYITGPLITRIAEAWSSWDRAVLMMQKEVASRILAPAGNSDRGSLSVFLQAQFAIAKVVDVAPEAFVPPPKVASTVLEFVPLKKHYDRSLFDFIRTGFKQPRKTLANNLLSSGMGRIAIEQGLTSAGLDPRIRPHMLTLENWISLASALNCA